MIFSNLIKLDDALWKEIRGFDIFLKEGLKTNLRNQNSKYGLRFAEKSSNDQERNF